MNVYSSALATAPKAELAHEVAELGLTRILGAAWPVQATPALANHIDGLRIRQWRQCWLLSRRLGRASGAQYSAIEQQPAAL